MQSITIPMRTEETDQGKSADREDEPAERGVPGGQQGRLAEQEDELGEQGVSECGPEMLTREDDCSLGRASGGEERNKDYTS